MGILHDIGLKIGIATPTPQEKEERIKALLQKEQMIDNELAKKGKELDRLLQERMTELEAMAKDDPRYRGKAREFESEKSRIDDEIAEHSINLRRYDEELARIQRKTSKTKEDIDQLQNIFESRDERKDLLGKKEFELKKQEWELDRHLKAVREQLRNESTFTTVLIGDCRKEIERLNDQLSIVKRDLANAKR